jgi:hypothetical protein
VLVLHSVLGEVALGAETPAVLATFFR